MAEGRLAGARALITGASRGIGAEIARAYAREGARLVICARSVDAVQALAEEIRSAGGEAIATGCDVTSEEQVAALVDTAQSALGGVDVLVNNAGAYKVCRFTDADVALYRHLIEVNYLGTVAVTRAFIGGMLEAGYGKVVNVASTAGKYGSALQAHYNGSKHAVVGFTRSVALELAGAGIRMNAICPGFVNTPMVEAALPEFAALHGVSEEQALAGLLQRVPIGRMLEPEEIAHLAVYLGSRESDGMTGQAMTISGGMVLV